MKTSKPTTDSWVPHAGEHMPGQPSWVITQVFDWDTYWDITLVNQRNGHIAYDRIPKPKKESTNQLPTNNENI